MAKKQDLQSRIIKHSIPVTESGCWIWMGLINKQGYGLIAINGILKKAHRVSYQAFRGGIPKQLVSDHLCRVRCCVNPWHIEIVTNQENIRRGVAGINNRSKTHCIHGHELSGENLYINKKKERGCRVCRSKFGKEFRSRNSEYMRNYMRNKRASQD